MNGEWFNDEWIEFDLGNSLRDRQHYYDGKRVRR